MINPHQTLNGEHLLARRLLAHADALQDSDGPAHISFCGVRLLLKRIAHGGLWIGEAGACRSRRATAGEPSQIHPMAALSLIECIDELTAA